MTSPSSRQRDSAIEHDPVIDAISWRRTPPQDAVSLAELIADAGPLPPDAALECVQRLAERLSLDREAAIDDLSPGNVLIDDDGGVWLREVPQNRNAETGGVDACDEMGRLGRLLVFLATGEEGECVAASAINVADLPLPLRTVASRLLSQNGSCYLSFDDLVADAARLRGLEVGDSRAITHEPVEEQQPESDLKHDLLIQPHAEDNEADIEAELTSEARPSRMEIQAAVPSPISAAPIAGTEPSPTDGQVGPAAEASGRAGIPLALVAGVLAAIVIAFLAWQFL